MIPGRISVLIACYQHGPLLDGALASVFGQTWPDMEAIVVNDGSTDSTAEVILAWQRKRPGLVERVETPRVGQAAARAAALELARGEFYITLDADDLLEPRMADRTRAALEAHPDAALAAADVWMVDESALRPLRLLRQDRQPVWPSVLEAHPLGGVAGLLVRTEAARRIGGLTVPGIPGAEDWDFAVRMARAGMRTVPVREALARYRQSRSSYSRSPLPMLRSRLAVLDRCREPDPRLPVPPDRQPVLDEAAWRRLRNRQVFFVLGLAARGAPEKLSEILTFRMPGETDPATLASSFARGAGHAEAAGISAAGSAAAAFGPVSESLAASGETALIQPLRRALQKALWSMRFPGPRTWLRRIEAWRAGIRFRRGATA